MVCPRSNQFAFVLTQSEMVEGRARAGIHHAHLVCVVLSDSLCGRAIVPGRQVADGWLHPVHRRVRAFVLLPHKTGSSTRSAGEVGLGTLSVPIRHASLWPTTGRRNTPIYAGAQSRSFWAQWPSSFSRCMVWRRFLPRRCLQWLRMVPAPRKA